MKIHYYFWQLFNTGIGKKFIKGSFFSCEEYKKLQTKSDNNTSSEKVFIIIRIKSMQE